MNYIDALEDYYYLHLFCFGCPTYPECEGSNRQDCKRRDEETDCDCHDCNDEKIV
jgi:hypothetical protein